MKPSVDLRSEAYVFWSSASDFRRDLRSGVPVNLQIFVTDMEVIHEMSDHPQIKARCQAALTYVTLNVHMGMLA
jgi:hypothetical protein